jgi:hypothetical protein
VTTFQEGKGTALQCIRLKRKTKETQEIKVINAKALNAYLNQPKNNKD